MRPVAAARRTSPPTTITVANIFQNPRLADLAKTVDEEIGRPGVSLTPSAVTDPAPFSLAGIETLSDLTHYVSSIAEQCKIAAGDIEDVYPCAPLQEGLMAITTKRPDKYVLRQVFHLNGDIQVFKYAWERLWEALTIMRTRIVPGKTGAVQVVIREPFPWKYASSLQAYLEEDRHEHMTYGLGFAVWPL